MANGFSEFPNSNLVDAKIRDALTSKADKATTYTKEEVDAAVAAATPSDYDSVKAQVTQNATDIDTIEGKMPQQASAQNKLADKEFVNSSIATNTATFRGTYNLVTDLSLTTSATNKQIASAIKTKLTALSITPENNDYCFVQVPRTDAESAIIDRIDRYKCTVEDSDASWDYEWSLNNSSFTADQWAAINSGITSALVSKLGALPTADALAVQLLAKYEKPSTGIPKADLSESTQASLGKADAALSRAEAEAGFTEWTYSGLPTGAVITMPPTYVSANWNFVFAVGDVVFTPVDYASGDEGATSLEWTMMPDDGVTPPVSVTATRTRLPTMADIPTDNAQLANGAGYATMAAMNAALAGKADATSLPYALVTVTPTDGAPFVLAACFPIVYTPSGGSAVTVTAADMSELSVEDSEEQSSYLLKHNTTAICYILKVGNTYGGLADGISSVTFGDPATTPTYSTQVLGFTLTAQLIDRASSAVSLSADATLVFPAQTAGKARDFVVRLTLTETNNVVPSVTFPADVAYETEGGEWPDLTAAGTYIVRLTEVPKASQLETARFFLQCSSAVSDATPPSAGGAS